METSLHVFSEDYSHFEQNRVDFPVEAQSVFHSITELRVALNEFRKATENKCVVDDDIAIASVVTLDAPSAIEISTAVPEGMITGVVPEDIISDVMAEASLGSPKETESQ